MKTFTKLLKAVAFILLLTAVTQARAQNAPIGCDSKFFVSYGSNNSSTSTTTVNQLSITAGNVAGTAFPTDPVSIGFNGMGLNPIDGYIYALRYPANNERVRLVRVGLGTPGNVTDLGEINNASGTNLQDEVIAYSGCFDANGTFLFVTTNNRLFSMANNQLGSAAGLRNATYIATIPASDYFADIAIDPTDGQMYGVTIGNDYGVYRINKTTGASTRLGTYPNSGSPMIGLFFTENGNMYAYRSNGAFYLLNKTNGSGTAAGTGPSYTFADGCSCSFRVGHDLNAPLEICPTAANAGQPEFNFTLTIQNLSGAIRPNTTYTLTMPARFRFTQSAATIAANFAAAGLTNSGAVISSVAGGTNNQLVVNNMNIPNLVAVPNVLIGAKLIVYSDFTTASFQSQISGLPAGIGSADLSNDPKTVTPDDPTIIGRCPGTPLAVKLISFSGSYRNSSTMLNWQTEGELNFDKFEIERSSNGADFYPVGEEDAKGTVQASKQTYAFADNLSAISGEVFYYRLKMIDQDGNFKYSSIIVIQRGQKMISGLSLNPNPVVTGGSATVRLQAVMSGKADLRVVDLNGRTVLQQQANVVEGMNNIAISQFEKLLPGMYVLQVSNVNQLEMVKFIVGQ